MVAFPMGKAACVDPTTGIGGATVDGLTCIVFAESAAPAVGTGGAGPSATTMRVVDAFDEAVVGNGVSTLLPASAGGAA